MHSSLLKRPRRNGPKPLLPSAAPPVALMLAVENQTDFFPTQRWLFPYIFQNLNPQVSKRDPKS